MKNIKEEEEMQRKTFARNLNFYIQNSGKSQKEVAEALGFPPTTFNTWCKGKILPSSGKIQHIADYFGIGKTDLTEPHGMNKIESFTAFERNIILAYRDASDERKESVLLLLGLKE